MSPRDATHSILYDSRTHTRAPHEKRTKQCTSAHLAKRDGILQFCDMMCTLYAVPLAKATERNTTAICNYIYEYCRCRHTRHGCALREPHDILYKVYGDMLYASELDTDNSACLMAGGGVNGYIVQHELWHGIPCIIDIHFRNDTRLEAIAYKWRCCLWVLVLRIAT